jgi:hypothetical protein
MNIQPWKITMKPLSTLTMVVLLCLGSNALAQQRQQVFFKVPAESTKYIVSQNVDVDDVPNHIVRLFDVHWSLPNNPPTINGLNLADIFARGTADLTDGYGSTTAYFVFRVENGDKFFAPYTSVVQSASGKITATTVGHITGGTGQLAGIHGIIRQIINIDPRPGAASPGDSQYEIDYSIDK